MNTSAVVHREPSPAASQVDAEDAVVGGGGDEGSMPRIPHAVIGLWLLQR